MCPDAREMLGAGVAQAVGHLGRGRVERGHRRILRIEQAQHVASEAVTLEGREGVAMPLNQAVNSAT